jgi:hypothetical protein
MPACDVKAFSKPPSPATTARQTQLATPPTTTADGVRVAADDEQTFQKKLPS